MLGLPLGKRTTRGYLNQCSTQYVKRAPVLARKRERNSLPMDLGHASDVGAGMAANSHRQQVREPNVLL